MGRRQRIDYLCQAAAGHLAPTGRSQIGDLAVARVGEGRVPFLLSKHCADGANLVAGRSWEVPSLFCVLGRAGKCAVSNPSFSNMVIMALYTVVAIARTCPKRLLDLC
jgi:hypothetical protein